jgi:hypothetical protein
MFPHMPSVRSRLLVAIAVLAVSVSLACSDQPAGPSPGSESQNAALSIGPDVRTAIAAQERHTARLLALPGVVGTGVGLNPAGRPVVRVFTAAQGTGGIPANLDGVPVAVQVTGAFVVRSDPTTRQRPAPLGFSVGHPDITAGTIGARVKDGSGKLYILSNNHVLANSNAGALGDPTLQPGPYDGGQNPADAVGSLAKVKLINFSGGSNTMDAALAGTTSANVGNSTPADDGYGTPASAIFGDADHNGLFDNKANLLGLAVQKYGRTTGLTKGTISEINVTVTVCYEGFSIFCSKSATFTDQVAIGSSSFSDGGDSGSLIVTDNTGRNPVALLFAGSSTRTLANRVDLVLQEFGVTVDGAEGGSPEPTGSSHVGDLDGAATINRNSSWNPSITITVHDQSHAPVANATVSGSWSNGTTGGASCTTGGGGSCVVRKSNVNKRSSGVTFTVTGVSHGSLAYSASANHDADGGSNGTTITVAKP